MLGNYIAFIFTIIVTTIVKSFGIFFVLIGLSRMGLVQGTITIPLCILCGIGISLFLLESTIKYEPTKK